MVYASEQIHKEEANINRFLFVEDLNFGLTSKPIARYWQLRSGTFDEKKHLPLNQTGEGALKRKELAVLGTGFVKLLPNDNEGCPVVRIDSSRLGQSASERTAVCFTCFLCWQRMKCRKRMGCHCSICLQTTLLPLMALISSSCVTSPTVCRFGSRRSIFFRVVAYLLICSAVYQRSINSCELRWRR